MLILVWNYVLVCKNGWGENEKSVNLIVYSYLVFVIVWEKKVIVSVC